MVGFPLEKILGKNGGFYSDNRLVENEIKEKPVKDDLDYLVVLNNDPVLNTKVLDD